ncbi:MAG TPA: DUF2934 domain-containing protein [Terriglobales bacterium]|nr:DUF2934 domain-containing protein [Terriglobales bacterium]
MPNEKQPRGTATKRTTASRAPKAKDPTPISVPVTEEPVFTAQATVTTARNAVGVDANPSDATIDADEVRRRAYELYVERGRLDGYHEHDWFSAEQEMKGRKQSRSESDSRVKSNDNKRDNQRSA